MGTNIDVGICSGNEIENTAKKKRFAAPASEKSLNVWTAQMKTEKSIEWALWIFNAWVKEANECGEVLVPCLANKYPVPFLKFDRVTVSRLH